MTTGGDVALAQLNDAAILVADFAAAETFRLQWAGCTKQSVTRAGRGPGELIRVGSAAVTAGALILYDPTAKRVLRVTGDSADLDFTIVLERTPLGAKLAAVDSANALYFEERPLAIASEGVRLADTAMIVRVDRAGDRVPIATLRRAPVATRTVTSTMPNGNISQRSVSYSLPFQPEDAWTVQRTGSICIFRSGRNQLVCWSGADSTVGPPLALPTFEVSESDRLESSLPPGFDSLVEWPARKPATVGTSLVPSTDGLAYARLSTPAQDRLPRYAVIDERGELAMVLRLAAPGSLLLATPSHFYSVEAKEDGTEWLVRTPKPADPGDAVAGATSRDQRAPR